VFEYSYRNWIPRIVLALAISFLAGCSTIGEQSYIKIRPKTEVVRTTTSFSGALRCMDDLFTTHGVQGVPITTVGIPDATGQVRTGIRDMLITTVSKMSERSGAFRYVDWEYENKELQVLFQQVRDENQAAYQAAYENPRYYIRGAVTQFDKNVADRRVGGGLAGQYDDYTGDLVADYNANASVVALDLNIGDIRSRNIMPGLSSNNSLAIDRRGGAMAGALSNENLGLTFDFESVDAEGMHLAVRTLVELGAVESLGKLTRVPYWQCLQVEATAPGVQREMHDWWEDMSDDERQRFAENALVANGYLKGKADGLVDSASREAIARYQAEQDLVVSGRANFELYKNLIGSDRPLSAGPPETLAEEDATPDPLQDVVPVREPVQIDLFTDRGAEPTYAPMEFLRAGVQVSGNAFVYCYYQEGGGNVMQIFPNRFQTDGYVSAGEIVTIPGRTAGFQIRTEYPGSEEGMLCVASDREITEHLPRELRVRDLVPMPIESLDALAEIFSGIDFTALSQARLAILVAER
jgi:curli biogenesis system outer membrane secretion channel CsgG